MIRHLAGRAFRRLIATAGLARAADVESERRAGVRMLDAERARASREATARLEEFRKKVQASRRRLVAEHAQSNSLVGLLRHYLVRLRRAEAELAARAIADRRLKLEQLGIAIKVARRRGVSPAGADRAAHLMSTSTDYATAVARWRGGDVPPDVRRVTLGHLEWSVPVGTSDPLGRRILDRGQLPLDSLATIRQFAVGGAMLDIGAGIGVASIPRVVLGDFAQAYAAEPQSDNYLCLVGNTLDNAVEGRVLPYRVAISSTAGTVRVRRCGGTEVEDVPSLTLDEWVKQLGLTSYDVRFVRITLRDWNLNVLDAAASLLKRRQIVWQIEMDPSLLRSGTAPLDEFCRRVEVHFTHVKELGRYWADQWLPASEAAAVLRAVSDHRRAVNLLLLNLPGANSRVRSASEPPGQERPGNRPLISLLHSTARLPEGWKPAMDEFLAKARDPKNVEYILAVNEGEAFSLPSNALSGWGRYALVQEGVTGPNSGYNAAAKASRGDILITVADDYFPPEGWDERIRAAIPDVTAEVVLDVDNSDRVAGLLPFSFLTRTYYQRYGYILYPGYHGFFSDNEFTEQARRDGVIRKARHIVFEHRHPDRGTAPMDEIYARQRSHFADGKKLFRERKAKGFPKWPD